MLAGNQLRPSDRQGRQYPRDHIDQLSLFVVIVIRADIAVLIDASGHLLHTTMGKSMQRFDQQSNKCEYPFGVHLLFNQFCDIAEGRKAVTARFDSSDSRRFGATVKPMRFVCSLHQGPCQSEGTSIKLSSPKEIEDRSEMLPSQRIEDADKHLFIVITDETIWRCWKLWTRTSLQHVEFLA